MDVVDETIGVVVDAVAGNLQRVGPHVRSEVGVRKLNAFVNDADRHRPRAGVAGCPGLAGRTAELVGGRCTVAVHSPEVATGVVGVIRGDLLGEDIVGLGVAHAGTGLELRNGGRHRLARGEGDHLGGVRPLGCQSLGGLRARLHASCALLHIGGRGAVTHDEGAGLVLGKRLVGGCCSGR